MLVVQLDALAFLRDLSDESVDLVITDPPYESLEKHRAVGTTTRLKHSKASSNDWFDIFPNEKFPQLFAELYRVLKRGSHLYTFCDKDTCYVAQPIGVAAGFTYWNTIVWNKLVMGMGYHYRRKNEFILFFEKGKRRLDDLGIPDVLDEPTISTYIEAKRIRGGYPTEKPVEVSDVFIEQSSKPGDLVVDPFCGSGSVGRAALAAGRRFLGADTAPSAVSLANSLLAP